MSDEKYLKRNDVSFCLAHVVEECGEVTAAIGKTQRWGLESYNPELPPEKRETNRAWVLRELDDLEEAIGNLRALLHPSRPSDLIKKVLDGKPPLQESRIAALNSLFVEQVNTRQAVAPSMTQAHELLAVIAMARTAARIPTWLQQVEELLAPFEEVARDYARRGDGHPIPVMLSGQRALDALAAIRAACGK